MKLLYSMIMPLFPIEHISFHCSTMFVRQRQLVVQCHLGRYAISLPRLMHLLPNEEGSLGYKELIQQQMIIASLPVQKLADSLMTSSKHCLTSVTDSWGVAGGSLKPGLDRTKIVFKECHIQTAMHPSKSKINSSACLKLIYVMVHY